MILKRRLILVLALLTAACAAPLSHSPSPQPSTSQVAAPSQQASSTPPASPSPTPTPFGAAVFENPDDCTNPEGGYRVAYPDAWYSNAAVANPLNPAGEGIAACRLFAPADFVVVYGTEIPRNVAIWIRVDKLPEGTGWNYGPFPGYRVISDSETAVGGQPARVREIEVTEPNIAFAPGDRFTEYVIELSGNRYLDAQTYSQEDYDTSRLILDQMMQTLEFISP